MKFHLKHNPEENFDKSMLGHLRIIVALVKRQIGQGSSNSGGLVRLPFMSNFLDIFCNMAIKTWPKS